MLIMQDKCNAESHLQWWLSFVWGSLGFLTEGFPGEPGEEHIQIMTDSFEAMLRQQCLR